MKTRNRENGKLIASQYKLNVRSKHIIGFGHFVKYTSLKNLEREEMGDRKVIFITTVDQTDIYALQLRLI